MHTKSAAQSDELTVTALNFKLQLSREETAQFFGVSLCTLEGLLTDNHLSARRIRRQTPSQFVNRDHQTEVIQ